MHELKKNIILAVERSGTDPSIPVVATIVDDSEVVASNPICQIVSVEPGDRIERRPFVS